MLCEKVAREFWVPSLTLLYALWSRHLSEGGHMAQACVERSGAAETTRWACSLNQPLFVFLQPCAHLRFCLSYFNDS